MNKVHIFREVQCFTGHSNKIYFLFFFLMNCTFVHNNKKNQDKLSLDKSKFIFNLMNVYIFLINGTS